jgi:pyridoxamine 5'-phosphate oxidase
MSSITDILENLRVSYQAAKLDIEDCNLNPELQFDKWFEEALKAKCDEPNAFILSTVANDQPRGRVVLLKAIENGQFVFYTNYQSAKGQELNSNSKVAATFLWLPLHRQVRIEGTIVKVAENNSDEYFQKRPRGSQIGAIASPQSRKINSRAELERMFSEVDKKFSSHETLPRPINWGGYGIIPTYFEFWQGRNNRMHDRICYTKQNSSWILHRLAP